MKKESFYEKFSLASSFAKPVVYHQTFELILVKTKCLKISQYFIWKSKLIIECIEPGLFCKCFAHGALNCK